MYCNSCHHEYQPIHEKIRGEFTAFVAANRKWIDMIYDGDIVKLPDRLPPAGMRRFKLFPTRKATFSIYNIQLLEEPYNVRYVGVRDYGEGAMIEFMDEKMDKVFSFYDVM